VNGSGGLLGNKLSFEPHPAIAAHFDLADRLRRAFGPSCEIVLHDLRFPESSLVHVAGSVTGRSPGAPITNLVLEAIQEFGDDVRDLYNYRSEAPNGHPLRSSTLFIRDGSRVVGALCINIDLAPFEQVAAEVQRLMAYEQAPSAPAERFERNVAQVLGQLIADVMREVALRPSEMAPDDRLRVVTLLEGRGAFLIKGAVDSVARRLGVSKFTVYSYLQQLRAARSVPAREEVEPLVLER
jgi:predicted transcriptional regulator YheO